MKNKHTTNASRSVTHAVATALLLVLVTTGCDGKPPTLEEIKSKTRQQYPQLSHVEPKQVGQWLKDADGSDADPAAKPVMLDARKAEEFAVSHLRDAKRVDPAAEAQAISKEQLKSVAKDQRIVVYCSVGVRSARIAQRLREAGYTNVHNMNGSIFQWANEDRPVYRGDEKVEKVHPYDKHWGELLKPARRADVD